MYINTEIDQYPVSEQEIRQSHPNTSFPTPFVPPPEYEWVFPTPQPQHDTYTEGVREIFPVKSVKGTYEQQWEVYSLPSELVEQNLSVARELKWNEIKAERDRRKYLGVKVGEYWFHTDDPSRIQFLGLARKADKIELIGGNMETPFSGPGPGGILVWKTIKGDMTPMTPLLAQQVVAATEILDIEVFAVAEYHRAAMLTSNNPASYNFYAGWPPNIEDVE